MILNCLHNFLPHTLTPCLCLGNLRNNNHVSNSNISNNNKRKRWEEQRERERGNSACNRDMGHLFSWPYLLGDFLWCVIIRWCLRLVLTLLEKAASFHVFVWGCPKPRGTEPLFLFSGSVWASSLGTVQLKTRCLRGYENTVPSRAQMMLQSLPNEQPP